MVTFGLPLKNPGFLMPIMGRSRNKESLLETTRDNCKLTWKKFRLRKFSLLLTWKQMSLQRFTSKLLTLMACPRTRRSTQPSTHAWPSPSSSEWCLETWAMEVHSSSSPPSWWCLSQNLEEDQWTASCFCAISCCLWDSLHSFADSCTMTSFRFQYTSLSPVTISKQATNSLKTSIAYTLQELIQFGFCRTKRSLSAIHWRWRWPSSSVSRTCLSQFSKKDSMLCTTSIILTSSTSSYLRSSFYLLCLATWTWSSSPSGLPTTAGRNTKLLQSLQQWLASS